MATPSEPVDGEISSVDDVKRLIGSLSLAVQNNMQARARSPNDPRAFLPSELELDAALDSASVLATRLDLLAASSQEVQLQLIDEITGLLLHDNEDVIRDAIGLLVELTDPDYFLSEDCGPGGLAFVDRTMDSGTPQALVQCVLDKGDDLLEPVFRYLECLCEIYPQAGPHHLCTKTALLPLLYDVVEKPALPATLKSSACELIANLMSEELIVHHSRAHMEIVLRAADQWNNRTASSLEEEELIESIYHVICLWVSFSSTIFETCGGFDLMARVNGHATPLAIKVLDFACSKVGEKRALDVSVQSRSLSIVFPALSGRFNPEAADTLQDGGEPKRKRVKHRYAEVDAVHHALSYLYSASLHASPEIWVRVSSKFAQDECRHVGHTLHDELERSLERLDDYLESSAYEDDGEDEDDSTYLARMEHGLEHVQWISSILGKLIRDDASSTFDRAVRRAFPTNRLAEMRAAIVERASKLDQASVERKELISFAESLK